MTEISEELVENQVEELKERDDVRAIAIVGGYARDPDANQNDLDIYIIVEGDWRKRVTEQINDVVVEKFFNSKEWAEKYLKDKSTSNSDWWLPYSWFTGAEIRYDPENIFKDLEQTAEEVREEKMSEDVNEEEILYFIWDKKQDIDTEDVAQKRYMMYQLFDYLLETIYRKNGEVPVKDNYRIEKLQEFDGYMYKLAQDFLMASSTMEKERKLDKIVEHVTKGMGDPNPEWETEREELD